ncbi:MAG: hypothetical protein ACE5D6_01845 [Candidatus Zixiibacteriota bacterium]
MRNILLISLILLVTSNKVTANNFINLAGEFKIPLAQGWQLKSDSIEYPFLIVNDELSGELLIFKSILSAEEAITNNEELKISVDNVIEDVILSLPKAKLITNTGYSDHNRVWFTIEFMSVDTLNKIDMLHLFTGILYRHPDGTQLLFTLWGNTTKASYPVLSESMKFMQNGFIYYGETENEFFIEKSMNNWLWIVLLILLLTLTWSLTRRKRKTVQSVYSKNNQSWRCLCGELNPARYQTCQGCGNSDKAKVIT